MFLIIDAWPIDVERYLSSNPGWLHSWVQFPATTAFFLPECNQPGLEDKYISISHEMLLVVCEAL